MSKTIGVCKVGEKGQIVIPKDARELFNINPGDVLICLGDSEKGIALVKTTDFDYDSKSFIMNKGEKNG